MLGEVAGDQGHWGGMNGNGGVDMHGSWCEQISETFGVEIMGVGEYHFLVFWLQSVALAWVCPGRNSKLLCYLSRWALFRLNPGRVGAVWGQTSKGVI